MVLDVGRAVADAFKRIFSVSKVKRKIGKLGCKKKRDQKLKKTKRTHVLTETNEDLLCTPKTLGV